MPPLVFLHSPVYNVLTGVAAPSTKERRITWLYT
nr:MAG TPA: hypothetical protein [Caudoviricetes sp.]